MTSEYRRHPQRLDSPGGMLDGISAVLGALVVVTPFMCLETGNFPAALSAFACGFAVMGLAYLDGPEPEPWTRWVSGVLSVWVAVSPWVLQRALVSVDVVLAPPMSDPAASMPVVLGFGIVVSAALDIVLTAMESRRSIPSRKATASVPKATSAAFLAIPSGSRPKVVEDGNGRFGWISNGLLLSGKRIKPDVAVRVTTDL